MPNKSHEIATSQKGNLLEPREESAEIRDPIHGYIFATELERRIIDTASFQRLRRIRQLAGCHLVYPGGQHSRFEHVIGCKYLAGKVGTILESRESDFSREDTEKLRLAALLHDIGHGPFSHMFEEVLADKTAVTHEDMTQRIIKQTEVGDILESGGFSRNEISELSIGKLRKKNRAYMNDAIGGGLSVDIMDYLLRDSYFTGVEYGKVDITRIINSFEAIKGRLAIGQAALFAFEALLIARYEMFRAVYFHRTVRAAELMLIKSMILADKSLHLTDLSLDNYLSLTDEVTLHRIVSIEPGQDPDLISARELARDYLKRNLLKCAFEKPVQRRDKLLAAIFNQKDFRVQFSQKIADTAGVQRNDVYVDVPTAPSIPVTSTRESLQDVMVVARRDTKNGGKSTAYSMGIQDFPLVGTIAGYMDVLRVYTTSKNKGKVEKAAEAIFGREGYESKVSM